MALDYGRRRIGVAVTDPGRVLAAPHSTLDNRARPGEPPESLLVLLREIEAVEVVVGIPFNMDGSEGPMAEEARRFARRIGEETGLPVHERDERLSSVEAERRIEELALPKGKRRDRGRRDMMAASVLLEDFLAEG